MFYNHVVHNLAVFMDLAFLFDELPKIFIEADSVCYLFHIRFLTVLTSIFWEHIKLHCIYQMLFILAKREKDEQHKYCYSVFYTHLRLYVYVQTRNIFTHKSMCCWISCFNNAGEMYLPPDAGGRRKNLKVRVCVCVDWVVTTEGRMREWNIYFTLS